MPNLNSAFIITPQAATLHPTDRPACVQFTFCYNKEVRIHEQPILRCQVRRDPPTYTYMSGSCTMAPLCVGICKSISSFPDMSFNMQIKSQMKLVFFFFIDH